jgi:pimeloyl-ACP methyl ester carboxylesterase
MSSIASVKASESVKKSTNVRTGSLKAQALRLGVKTLSTLAPALSVQLLSRYMFRIRQFPRPEWEKELLEEARSHSSIPWRDGEISVWSWGEGPPVLLVHGWEGRGTQLGRFIPGLLAQGFSVVAFDGPGHGRTTTTRGSMPDQAAAVERVDQAFGPFSGVIGHSMGAGAITYAAVKGARLGSMVLAAPPLDPRLTPGPPGSVGRDSSTGNLRFESASVALRPRIRRPGFTIQLRKLA